MKPEKTRGPEVRLTIPLPINNVLHIAILGRVFNVLWWLCSAVRFRIDFLFSAHLFTTHLFIIILCVGQVCCFILAAFCISLLD